MKSMNSVRILSVLFPLIFFATMNVGSAQELNSEVMSLSRPPMPENQKELAAFLGWTEQKSDESANFDLAMVKPNPLRCQNTRLVPSHPQMSSKLYHLAYSGSYDHFKLTASDRACAYGGKKINGKGVLPCFRPDIFKMVLMSDIFKDACGNYYRGFKKISFFKSKETMETLFSPGRKVIPLPGSEFGEVLIGPTSAVDVSELNYLAELFPGDQQNVVREQKNALEQGFTLNPETGLYTRRPSR